MREINVSEIIEVLENMCIEANCCLNNDIKEALERGMATEKNELGKSILSDILENAEIAKNEMMPICQDTGMAVIFLKIGQDVHIVGGNLTKAINEGVRRGYEKGYLRKSVVADPIRRGNTGDNTPAIIHTEIVEGEKLEITIAPKGFGSENMSAVKMLKPSDGVEGVIDFVLETVKKAGGNPCPPLVIGVGIGGTFEKVAYLAKLALLRNVNSRNSDKYYSDLEETLHKRINDLNIGPQGFGGTTTALGVNIESFPTHIAGMPCAVNINCHASRHKKVII
ncbi:MAG: fumarate hydratase [Oscillospiraceae bacterium]